MSRPLAGLSFALSGFVNPERSSLRQVGLDLGAKYDPEWTPLTTHLICAIAGTPKALQVRSQTFCQSPKSIADPSSQVQQTKAATLIVAKEWLSACSAVGKREDEARFSLDGGKSAARASKQVAVAVTSPQSGNKTSVNAASAAVVSSGNGVVRTSTKVAAGPAVATSPPTSKRQRQTNGELGRIEV